MKYRKEIDGLRAVAVVPVLLFHAQIPGFDGGYVGVDIFFVISGFLITTIIVSEIEGKNFSLRNFYVRRALRLLPALFFMLLLCLPFSWFWMLPDDLENFGQSLIASVLFSNNILLTLTTGYWDLAAEFKPLLHTWSLAVEEQYYIVFPLALLLVWRWGHQILLPALVTTFVMSIILSVAPLFVPMSTKSEAAIFYLLPTRSWEILTGAIGAVVLRRNLFGIEDLNRTFPSYFGLALIFIGTLFPSHWGFPEGARIAFAVLGTILILLFARDRGYVKRFLSISALVSIGLISYSLYLFHQPLLAFFRVYVSEDPGSWLIIPLLCAFPMAYISYRFVEQPFRNARVIPTRIALTVFVTIGTGIVAFGYSLNSHQGFPSRIGTALSVENTVDYNKRANSYIGDKFPATEFKNVLVIGNSFGRDAINMLLETTPDVGLNLVYRNDIVGCIGDLHAYDLKQLYDDADILLYASSVTPRQGCVEGDLDIARANRKELYYLGTKHFGYNLNWVIRVESRERGNLQNKLISAVVSQEREMSSMIPEQYYISILDRIASDGMIPITDENGELLSPDRTHLTLAGARYLGSKVLSDTTLWDSLFVNKETDR
ncbi:Peptidoglycan/LPS O-acetylase OafA/YrhL, contains acyltransferase and SGNH-hydrolase domains [Shimia gijangensis]|uniref:Peptidoglycan/LPS O-acetylase OafA/YrhL, contains acyltransferase and SGNH-hydrolase domains n=1 Tax=Shimia gijangensis TaxID=1470563 RepID=A0A1M6SEM8_9RHOB|nr:acyltransferase [Shimia gijangensis]SHK43135.1 Peptidoglycan/LPS O-acetylase OafA/YrhL, contains acyltransferase and SGNH-hydrolase domains [Shimia gijangensis]